MFIHFQALVGSSSRSSTNKYSRLDQDIERSNQDFIEDQEQQQQVALQYSLQWHLSRGIVTGVMGIWTTPPGPIVVGEQKSILRSPHIRGWLCPYLCLHYQKA